MFDVRIRNILNDNLNLQHQFNHNNNNNNMKTNLSPGKAFANCKTTSDKFCLFCQLKHFLPQFVNCRTEMDIAIMTSTKIIEKTSEGILLVNLQRKQFQIRN